MKYSRRKFIQSTGIALSGITLPGMAALPVVGKRLAPSDTLNVGLIGCRGMGAFDLKNHLKLDGVECAALCDVDSQVLADRTREIAELTGKTPANYADYRKLLEDKEIDIVIIGTPDHWHCLQMVDACDAGKDVYVEKPMANSIAECKAMVDAVQKYNRIVQVGQQQRSGKHWKAVVDFVQSGKLGKIRRVKVWANFNYGKGLEKAPDQNPPPELDWNMYLGPAPDQPFNPSRVHGGWRHQWDFGGGLLSDWGVHLLDIVLWAMDVKGAPRSVSATGGIRVYPDRAIETPDTLDVVYDMGDFTLSWEHNGGIQREQYERIYGIAFVGEDGTLVVNRESWQIYPEVREGKYAMEALPRQQGQNSYHAEHAANFVNAVRNRTQPACTVREGYAAAFIAHMGNIAWRTGSRLVWDETKQGFADNKPASQLIQPRYRKPWEMPG
ncbi:MAG: Gfo/Idh/MocA family oxidoreductase [Bacteroidia bacterium]